MSVFSLDLPASRARERPMTRLSPVPVAALASLLVIGTLAPFTGPVAAAGPAQSPAVEAFDGERALAHAAAMVELGPRPLGTEALEENRRYIEEQLRAVGLEPRRDGFEADTPIGAVPMANVLADIPAAGGDRGSVLLLGGHYDTKLYEAVEFVGANDGASSAGILLELGRVLTEHPPPVPVRLVFFDGEEAVVRWSPLDGTYGSRHMVARLQEEGRLGEIGALILFDMVGDAELSIPREVNSTDWLMDVIWDAGAELGYDSAFPDRVHAIEDDHLPFRRVGIDAVDLIDFEYGPGNRYWHSPFDTLDKLSATSFQIVGETVLHALPRVGERMRE